MSVVEGIDEFEEFADDIDAILGNGRIDGLQKARRDALRKTADEFITAITGHIKARQTNPDEGPAGTLYSETSPYSPGGENESSGDTLHIQNKNAWQTELLGNDFAAVFPKQTVWKRAFWLNYGTESHGPDGNMPMFFHKKGQTIAVTKGDPEDNSDPNNISLEGEGALATVRMGAEVDGSDVGAPPAEVDGVTPQRFYEDAFRDLERGNRFKVNMGEELDKLFEKRGLPLKGAWL